jgi:hypothetical protein
MNAVDVVPDAVLGLPDERRIAPGRPESSAILQRMKTRGENGMPPLGSLQIDRDGSTLIEQFIVDLGSG